MVTDDYEADDALSGEAGENKIPAVSSNLYV